MRMFLTKFGAVESTTALLNLNKKGFLPVVKSSATVAASPLQIDSGENLSNTRGMSLTVKVAVKMLALHRSKLLVVSSEMPSRIV